VVVRKLSTCTMLSAVIGLKLSVVLLKLILLPLPFTSGLKPS
jgi:hypothetical protein